MLFARTKPFLASVPAIAVRSLMFSAGYTIARILVPGDLWWQLGVLPLAVLVCCYAISLICPGREGPLGPGAHRQFLSIPFLYFAGIVPKVAVHWFPDQQIIAALFAALLCIAGQDQSREQRFDADGEISNIHRLVHGLLLFGICSAFLYVRLTDLDYNAPFMDELLNFEISSMGNIEGIAGDSRLWGVLAYASNQIGGLAAVRAVNGTLSTGTLAFFYLLTGLFSAPFALKKFNLVPIVATSLLAFAAPYECMSSLGTHDSLALLFFISGFYFLVKALLGDNRMLATLAAYGVFLSFASRFFLLSTLLTLPWFTIWTIDALRSKELSSNAISNWFWKTLALFIAIFVLFDGVHIYKAIAVPARLAASLEQLSYGLVTSGLLLFMLPILTLLSCLLLFPAGRALGYSAKEQSVQRFLLVSAALLPLIHLVKGSDFGMEKNLSYSILFLAPLVGMRFSNVLRRSSRSVLLAGLPVIAALFCWTIRYATPALMPNAIRTHFSRQVGEVVNRVEAEPLKNLPHATLDIMQARWIDTSEVLDAVKQFGFQKQKIALLGQHGGDHLSLYLTHYLGRDQLGEYYVDQSSAWRKNLLEYSAKQEIPIVIAVIPETRLAPFERLPKFPQYQFFGQTQLRAVPGYYGRVLFFVNPLWIDASEVPVPQRNYFEAVQLAAAGIPRAVASLDRSAAERAFTRASELLEQTPNEDARWDGQLELAKAYAYAGNGERAASLFEANRIWAQGKPNSLERYKLLQTAIDSAEPCRVKFGTDTGDLGPGKELIDYGVAGTTPMRDVQRFGGKSFWHDFNPPIIVPEGATIRLDMSLDRGLIRGLRLLRDDQDPSQPYGLVRYPFANGRQILFWKVPAEFKLKQIDSQVGETAWGPLGGSPVAVSTVHSASVHFIEPVPLAYCKFQPRSLPAGAPDSK